MSFLLLIQFSFTAYAQDIRATTEDGRKVILRENGTWNFLKAKSPNTAGALFYNKLPKASKLLRTKITGVELWYDPSIWFQKYSADPYSTSFDHKDGNITASLIVEEPDILEGTLKEIAIGSARQISPDIRVLFDEIRKVNGKEYLCLKMNGSIQNIPFTFYGYYYSGENGVVQFLTYSLNTVFEDYESDMIDLLNGLTVTE